LLSIPTTSTKVSAGHSSQKLGMVTLDAWTRDLPGTLRWYRAMGFIESDHYLHV
jgi:hypothetical protein